MPSLFNNDPWLDAMKAKGHSPVMVNDDPDCADDPEDPDRIDMFAAHVPDGHNGPRCKVCGWDCCRHCTSIDKIPQCDVIEATVAPLEIANGTS